MKKFFRGLMVFAMALAIVMPMAPVMAQTDPFGTDVVNTELNGVLGESNSDPRAIATRIINIILTFLGLLAVVIILIGGFKWMTAGGNEENVAAAQKIIVSGIIGLVIILASWGIATFVLSQISGAVNG
jgi:hypothetical protein